MLDIRTKETKTPTAIQFADEEEVGACIIEKFVSEDEGNGISIRNSEGDEQVFIAAEDIKAFQDAIEAAIGFGWIE